MNNRSITFTGAYTVELREDQVSADALLPDQVLIESLYTAVSPGTELACLSGWESWFRFPGIPGYCNVGRIVAAGPAVTKFAEGDVVLNYGAHRKYNVMSAGAFMLKVPDGLDLKVAPLTRLATVAFTSVRVSNIELGDDVAVVGLGPVGNLAAQLAGLQGGRVIGLDPVQMRIEVARSCGLEQTIDPSQEDATARIKAFTNGAGVHTLIDATGNPKVVVNSLPWIGQAGELILLGSPRGELQTDVTDVLNYVHLWGRGCITFKGAHEWRYPVLHDPFVKHSLERNSRIVWQLMQGFKLRLDPLVTHVVKPEDAVAVYDGLRQAKERYLGVIFDWS
jgi:2-desacetyl-2-hydroxyethyl bacteriochlorophyllide A dehydrogenase